MMAVTTVTVQQAATADVKAVAAALHQLQRHHSESYLSMRPFGIAINQQTSTTQTDLADHSTTR